MASMNEEMWIDKRPIAELNFGVDNPETTASVTADLRELFTAAGCQIAEDIAHVGCTGLYKHLCFEGTRAVGASTPKTEIEADALNTCIHVRKNMAGAGIGLTCFVGPDRFCLVHNTIGGLQERQEQKHAEVVGNISRDLTAKERGHVELVQHARRIRGKKNSERMTSAMDALTGEKLPAELVPENPSAPPASDVAHLDVSAPVASASASAGMPLTRLMQLLHRTALDRQLDLVLEFAKLLPDDIRSTVGGLALLVAETPEPWKCSEHAAPLWTCRFCAAQAVVDGPFEPKYLMAPTDYANLVTTDAIDEVAPAEVDATVARLADAGATAIGLYVKATAWRERFVRDE